VSAPSEGASIKCAVCGSRPFPELALPQVVPECFDLIKIGGVWGCPEHRPAKPKRARRPKTEVEALLAKLGRLVAGLDAQNLDSEHEQDDAKELIEKIGALVGAKHEEFAP
jgi:hypothetical protein